MLNGNRNIMRSPVYLSTEIKVNGNAVPQRISPYSIEIWKEVNRIPRATIIIPDGDPSGETFSVSESDWFVPGGEIEITVGYGGDRSTAFSGIITAQAIRAKSGGRNYVTVECSDPSVKMTTVPKSRYFYDMKESEMFQSVISEYSGLQADVESTSYTHSEMHQYQSTDWDFVLTRADVNGLICLVNGGTIQLKKPDLSGETVRTITFGRDLLEVDAEMDVTTQLAGVKSGSWDYSKTERSDIDGVSAGPDTPGNVSANDLASVFQDHIKELNSGGKLPPEIQQNWTDAKLLKHELSKVRGRVKIDGAGVNPGEWIELQGLGDRFNGRAFVSGVKHSVSDGAWSSDLQFGLSPEWFSEQFDISPKPASGMFSAVSGLQMGIVTQLDGDPQGDERILVRISMANAQERGVWARIATIGAGEERGLVFRPEIGDEVILGYIGDDPGQPVILGSVHSAAHPSPVPADDGNDMKGWKTRGGAEWMVDDSSPSVTVRLPSGRTVHMDDDSGETVIEDGDGNTIKLSSSGISIETSGDLSLKAGGDLKIEGMNVEASANANFKGSGSGGAELSSSGVTEVKGSLVKIN